MLDQYNEKKANSKSVPSLREVRDILSKVKRTLSSSPVPQESVTEHSSHASRSSFVSLSLPSATPTNVVLSTHKSSVMVDKRSLLFDSPCLYPLSRKGDAKEELIDESEEEVSEVEKESAADLQPLIRVVSGMEEGPREEDAASNPKEKGVSPSTDGKETLPLSGNLSGECCH